MIYDEKNIKAALQSLVDSHIHRKMERFVDFGGPELTPAELARWEEISSEHRHRPEENRE